MDHYYQIDALNWTPSFYAVDFEVREFVGQPTATLPVFVVKLLAANGDVHLVVTIADCDTVNKKISDEFMS